MSDFEVIRREQQRSIPKYPEGTIVSVNVVTALVQRMGSSQLVPCAYDPQQGVAVGKRCAYRWIPGRNKYVIQSVFGPPDQVISPDQNPSNFELAPPGSLISSDAIGGAVLLLWNVPVQRSVAFQVQVNTSASESGATSYYTRAGGILLPSEDELFFRVRSIAEDWRTSSWTAWGSQEPGEGGGGGGGLTEEEVEDVVAGLLVAGNNIDLTYNDGANTLTIDVEALTSADIGDFAEAVDDRVATLLTEGPNILLDYNDGAGTLEIGVGYLIAEDIGYVPGETSDWSEDPDPITVQEALDYLAARDSSTFSGDADDVPFTPTTGGDWTSTPTTVQEALDELGGRSGSSVDADWMVNINASVGITKNGSDQVSFWRNQGWNNHHFFYGGTTRQPTWIDNELNGEPVIHFDGVDERLGSPLDSNTLNLGFTLVFVIAPNDDINDQLGLLSLGNTPADGNPFFLVWRENTNVYIFVDGLQFTIAHATDDYKLYVIRWDGLSLYCNVNGSAETPITFESNTKSGDYLWLGTGYSNAAECSLAELRVANYPLTDSETTALETELMTKYGLS